MLNNTEKSIENLQPEVVVGLYYQAIKCGDLEGVKNLMTEQSYFMALDSLGLKLAFNDASFKQALKSIEKDEASLKKVEQELSKDLLSRKHSSEINIESIEPNGADRCTVHYTEDGKIKNLYFSKEEEGWKINYYAGRKVD